MRITCQKFSIKSILPLLLATFLLLPSFEGRAFAANASIPPYKTSGSVSGTGLLYDKLRIDSKGGVTIVISNPGRTGESFVANFSFYTEKGNYLTGFSIEGFAGRMSNTSYTLDLPNYKSMKKAAYMKVLGRSGRTGDN